MRLWAGLVSLFLASCGKYGDFKLPAAGGPSRDVRWIWEPEADAVLGRGAAGEFDSVDALNPSIARIGPEYVNLYSGWDGKVWRTGIATSPDGRAWRKKGLLMQPGPAAWEGAYIAANGVFRHEGDTFSYWYQAGDPPQIGLARAADLGRWEKLPHPVLKAGPRGSWDERGVADPFVLNAGGNLYMYYLGQDRARRQRLGVAVSKDGVEWTKSLANPILELGAPGAFDENGLGEPAVWPHFGKWWMLYTGRDKKEWRRMGLAVSPDGVKWARVGETALMNTGEGWNSRVVCDPEVELREDGTVRVWFGGGDRPEPAENLHGQIGVGLLRPVPVVN
ncbi:MAG: hypothetical protein HYX27_17455 [Acidobacteria bacterium]|nr:hypothetical protein [Acidobacteriota bacterium]